MPHFFEQVLGTFAAPYCTASRILSTTPLTDFSDHDDEFVYEKTDLPDDLILDVSGKELLNEKAYRIGAIYGFPIEEINKG